MINRVLRGAIIVAMTGAVALPAWAGELQLVGLKINHQDKGGIDALWHDERYYVSVSDLAVLDITTDDQEEGMLFKTPLGEAKIAFDELVYHDGLVYISFDSLKLLGITAEYLPSDLQIHLMVATLPKKQPTPKPRPIVTHTPSVAGLQGLQMNTQLSGRTNNDDKVRDHHQLDAFGYALGGTWGVSVSKDNDEKTKPKNII